MDYWGKRQELKARAATHTAVMAQKYRKEIEACIGGAETFAEGFQYSTRALAESCKVAYEPCTSIMAIAANSMEPGRMCVLDFADYMHPGGKFLEGSGAQEESLCHESFLYNVLKSGKIREEFFDAHKGRSNGCLYGDHVLYIPGIVFDDRYKCDVMVCAAPNKKAAMRYNGISVVEVDKTMQERCVVVLQVAAHKGVDTLILGAFGCGVFGNDARLVADQFKALLSGRFSHSFRKVVFAVPDTENGRYFLP